MDKLYEIKTKYTLEEHIKFNYALLFNGKQMLLLAILCIITLICGIISHLWYAVGIAIIFPIFLVLSVYFSAKKNYLSNKGAQDADVTIEFYENKMIQKTSVGSYTVEHDKIVKIIETKTHFYVMISRNQGIIIPKASMPNGLEEHIEKIVI